MNRSIYIPGLLLAAVSCNVEKTDDKLPNIIIVMADDLGFGDVGCYGNKIVKTPALDAMADEGIKFKRFYAASPVSSPTRGSLLTGRHPYRYGIPWAGRHPLPFEEITLAEALKTKGYATALFGKWHLGGLSKTVIQSYFPGGPSPYSPPWKHGFDESFATEAMMPTYNPYYHVGGDFGTEDYRYIQTEPVEKGQKSGGFRWRDHYWTGPGQIVDEWLEGDDSKIIMDRAVDFIERQSAKGKPFLSLIWFHAPHTPVVAGDEYRALYSDLDIQAQHWFGMVTAMDEQVGRLRAKLRDLQIEDNTIVWFLSDNGPSYIHDFNSAGGLRGDKGELFEGGIRVPAILEWPARIKQSSVSYLPVNTNDFYPIFLSICGIEMENQPLLDGRDVFELILNGKKERSDLMFFQSPLPARLRRFDPSNLEQFAVINNQYKLISVDNGKSFQFYDLVSDPSESIDIFNKRREKAEALKKELRAWIKSCENSAAGLDYQHRN